MAYANKVAGIYVIRNLINGHRYVGSTDSFQRRRYEHFRDLRRSEHDNIHLQRAYIVHGHHAFVFEIVEEVSDISLLLQREQHWINTTHPEYNISRIAGKPVQYEWTPERRARRSEINRTRVFTQEHRNNISRALSRRVVKDSTRRKHSEREKGKKLTLEQRLERKAKRDLHPRWRHTKESKRKLSEKSKNWSQKRTMSDEERKRRSEGSKRGWESRSEESQDALLRKMRSMKPEVVSEETKRKQSESLKKNWQEREVTEEYIQGLAERTRSHWAGLSEEEKQERRKKLSESAKKRGQRQREENQKKREAKQYQQQSTPHIVEATSILPIEQAQQLSWLDESA